MPPKGRGRTRAGNSSGGKSNVVISKPSVTKATKKSSVRSGAKKGRVKPVPDPPKILGLKSRKSELSVTFKIIGSHQKAALLALAQKSLDAANSDANFHKNQPEFRDVYRGLDERLSCLLQKHKCRRRYEEEVAQNKLKAGIQTINQNYKRKIDDLIEEAIARVQENILYVDKMSRVGGRIEKIPFCHGEDGRKVTKLAVPPKIVHPVAVPFSKFQLADERSVQKCGDNYLEQHPTNFWTSRTEAQKMVLTSHFISSIEANRRLSQDSSGKKRAVVASSLFKSPSALVIDTEGDEDDAQPDEVAVGLENANQDDLNRRFESSEDAAELSLDSYGVRIPRKKIRSGNRARPNNHMVVPRLFDFEDAEGQILADGSIGIQEIGFRTWTTSRNVRNRDYVIGSNNDPNPRYFYIPQRVSDINSGNNTADDMRSVAHIIKTHRLHPLLGIVLPGSLNPDYSEIKDSYFPPPTDRNSPLKPLQIHMIIQENCDGTISISRLQRSWIRQINEDFESMESRNKVATLLMAAGDHTEPEKHPLEIYDETSSIDKDLMSAVMAALKETEGQNVGTREVPAQPLTEITPRSAPKPTSCETQIKTSKAPIKAHSKVLVKANTKAPPRSFRPRYDPVRDSFPELLSQDIHDQNSSRIPFSHPLCQQNSNMLNELADYALGHPKTFSVSSSIPKHSPHIPPTRAHSTLSLHPQIVQNPVSLSSNLHSQSSQYHDTPSSLYPISHLISSSQGMSRQQNSSNQPIMPHSGYPVSMLTNPATPQPFYLPYQVSQITHNSQLPPPIHRTPQYYPPSTYTSSSSAVTTHDPPLSHAPPPSHLPLHIVPPLPSINCNPRLQLATSYNPNPPLPVMYASQPPPQTSFSHGLLETSNSRDLRPTTSQQPVSTPTAIPPTYSWRIGANYHQYTYPK